MKQYDSVIAEIKARKSIEADICATVTMTDEILIEEARETLTRLFEVFERYPDHFTGRLAPLHALLDGWYVYPKSDKL